MRDVLNDFPFIFSMFVVCSLFMQLSREEVMKMLNLELENNKNDRS